MLVERCGAATFGMCSDSIAHRRKAGVRRRATYPPVCQASAPFCVELGGPSPPRPAAGPDRRNPAYQRLKCLAVVGFARKIQTEMGRPVRSVIEVFLRLSLAPVDRIRP